MHVQPLRFLKPSEPVKQYRILITGSRDWEDEERLRKAIIDAVVRVCEETGNHGETDWVTIVHGACPTGADRMADELAKVCNWNVERHPADWHRYRKAAGYRRNADMVNAGADICLAFIRNESAGATHCSDLAEKAGIEVERYREPRVELSRRQTRREPVQRTLSRHRKG
jgi:hypothetical protein